MFPLKMKTIFPRGFSPIKCFRLGCLKKCTNGSIKKSAKDVKNLFQGPIHKAPDSFLVGFFEMKTFTLPVPPTPCHSARSRRRSRRIHNPLKNPRPSDQPLSTSNLLSIAQSNAWSAMGTTHRPCKSAKNSDHCVRWRCIDLHANACAASWLKFPEQCPVHQFFDEP